MSAGKETFPVMKNGVFFGYADADQIARNPGLSLYDERKAEAVVAEVKVKAAKSAAADKDAALALAQGAGSDPSAVKKAPSA